MLKQFAMLVLAAILGSLLTLGLMGPGRTRTEPPTGKSPQALQADFKRNTSPYALGGVAEDFRFAARKARPAVVHIATTHARDPFSNEGSNPFRFFFEDDPFPPSPFRDFMPREGTGSGVLYSPDGYIVTNYHVIAQAKRIEVTLSDNRSFEAVEVGSHPAADLAVLKIEARDLPTLEIADARQAEVGEWVLAIGNPLELISTVTAGIISARGRRLDLLPEEGAIESFIQTDAAVNPGNSGGALVNTRGELLGINTAIASQTGGYSGYSFAIPSNIVKRIADDLIQFGIFKRVFLGLDVSELDADYARELQLDVAQGLVVEGIVDGGPAAVAGLKVRDLIVAADGRAVRAVPDLQEILASASPGEELELTILRNGRRLSVSVLLEAK